MADAAWLFHTALMGDPVLTTGTSKRMEPQNGYGGPWNIRWSAWLDRSATGEHTWGPDGPAPNVLVSDPVGTAPTTPIPDPTFAPASSPTPEESR